MKKFLKILQIVLWILLFAGTGVMVGFSEAEHYKQPCRKVVVSIDYGAADALITKKDIDSLIL